MEKTYSATDHCRFTKMHEYGHQDLGKILVRSYQNNHDHARLWQGCQASGQACEVFSRVLPSLSRFFQDSCHFHWVIFRGKRGCISRKNFHSFCFFYFRPLNNAMQRKKIYDVFNQQFSTTGKSIESNFDGNYPINFYYIYFLIKFHSFLLHFLISERILKFKPEYSICSKKLKLEKICTKKSLKNRKLCGQKKMKISS